MFAIVSTLAKIERGLRPNARAAFAVVFLDEVVFAREVAGKLARDGGIPRYLASSVLSALATVEDVLRAIPREQLAPTVEAYHQLVSVMLHAYRLWNAVAGRNDERTAMYSLLLKHKAQVYRDMIEPVE